MKLRGRIDRVDTYKEGENVYVKVIDYKSGNKKFNLAALYYGLQLQLAVYSFFRSSGRISDLSVKSLSK